MASFNANLGEIDIIARYERWQIFGSLTFKGAEPSLSVAKRLMFAHLYRVCDATRTPFNRLVWVVRRENGEKFGRLHYHYLIGGMNQPATKGFCFFLNDLWKKLPRCGFAIQKPFNQRLNGVGYVTKCLSGIDTLGGDFYESAKFGSPDTELTLSNSLLRSVGGSRVGELRQYS